MFLELGVMFSALSTSIFQDIKSGDRGGRAFQFCCNPQYPRFGQEKREDPPLYKITFENQKWRYEGGNEKSLLLKGRHRSGKTGKVHFLWRLL